MATTVTIVITSPDAITLDQITSADVQSIAEDDVRVLNDQTGIDPRLQDAWVVTTATAS